MAVSRKGPVMNPFFDKEEISSEIEDTDIQQPLFGPISEGKCCLNRDMEGCYRNPSALGDRNRSKSGGTFQTQQHAILKHLNEEEGIKHGKPARWSMENLPTNRNSSPFDDTVHNQLYTPYKSIKPNPVAFHSTGYLSKKERYDVMPTPKTPSKRATTKFVPLASTPFTLKTSTEPLKIGASARKCGKSSGTEEETKLTHPSSSSDSHESHDILHGITIMKPFISSRLYSSPSTPDPPSKELRLDTSPSKNIFFDSSHSPLSTKNADFELSSESDDLEGEPMLISSYSSNFFCLPKWKTEKARFLNFDYFQSNESHFYEGEDYFQEKFEIISVIGSGSFAEVYKVRQIEDGNIYAIKKTLESFSGMADRSKKLLEVENIWKMSNSDYCIQIYQAWEQYGFLYMQTEYCESGNLKSIIEQVSSESRKFSEEQIWNILHQLCLGLDDIHAKNLMHLDLKPENILVTGNGLLKIADFGLSRDLSVQKMDEDMEGDKYYIAAEILDGHYSQAADIFSLGLIVLELVADIELPAQGVLWQNLRQGNFSELNFVDRSENLLSLMVQMLHPDWTKRPSTTQIISSFFL